MYPVSANFHTLAIQDAPKTRVRIYFIDDTATAIIGNNVKLYQGVTLGAKSFDTDADGNPIKGIPRHPIIGDNVVIYSNASILGRINIGANAVIGGNIWVTEDVAEGEKLVQAKANNFLRFKQ